jgi:hypothetical protein
MEVSQFLDNFDAELAALKSESDQVFGMLFPHTGKLLWQCRKFVDPVPSSLLGGVLNLVASRGINLYKDVLVPLVKAGSGLAPAALAELLSRMVVEAPLGIFSHVEYIIDPCDRGIVYGEHDPHFDFYDWVFPEGRWCAMVRGFLELADRFRRERGFVLPLPTLVYFIRRDEGSLLSRARRGDMMAVDPTYPDPLDEGWQAFRMAFNELAMSHGGLPHINKTRGGAITHFVNSHDRAVIDAYLARRQEFDPRGLFLNDFFRSLFGLTR